MNLAEARARHALVHVVGPPVVVPGDVQLADVGGHVVARADQVREAVAAGAGRVAAADVGARRVVELGPRDGHEVRAAGGVEVAVGPVGDVAVVDPDVVRVVLDRHRVVARRAADGRVEARVERAVAHAVADDLEVADDDVADVADVDVAVHLGAAQADDGLVRADDDSPRRQHALDVDHRRRVARRRRVERGDRGHRARHRAAAAVHDRNAGVGDRRPAGGWRPDPAGSRSCPRRHPSPARRRRPAAPPVPGAPPVPARPALPPAPLPPTPVAPPLPLPPEPPGAPPVPAEVSPPVPVEPPVPPAADLGRCRNRAATTNAASATIEASGNNIVGETSLVWAATFGPSSCA